MASDYNVIPPVKFEDIERISTLREKTTSHTSKYSRCIMDANRDCVWFYFNNDGLINIATRYGSNNEENILNLIREHLKVKIEVR